MQNIKRIEIDAVNSKDLTRILESLEIRDGFDNGKYKCAICGDVIGYENVRLIFPLPERVVGFICKQPPCMLEFTLRDEAQDMP